MHQEISIPAHLIFDGEIPSEAKALAGSIEKFVPVLPELSEWQKQRLGRITCSMFGKVKRLKSGAWGEDCLSYLYDLIGEHLTGQPSESFTGNKATEWGTQYEAEALAAYTKKTGRKTKPSRFLNDRALGLVGGTPDAFCGERGVIEVKCPLTFKNHLRTVITKKVPADYIDQVLGHLMLSGCDWCDFISYDPRIKGPHRIAIVRIRRDEHLQELSELAQRIIDFHGMLIEYLQKLKIKPIHSLKF